MLKGAFMSSMLTPAMKKNFLVSNLSFYVKKHKKWFILTLREKKKIIKTSIAKISMENI